MLSLGALSFTSPLFLLGLVALPALWLLLRVVPPMPRRVIFPPMALLARLVSHEDSPIRTPPWLMILRMLLAAVLILFAAGPILNPLASTGGSGPLVVLVDNGWAAGKEWPLRQQVLSAQIDAAARDGRSVLILPTAPEPQTSPAGAPAPRLQAPRLQSAAQARADIDRLIPRPWATARNDAVATVERLAPALHLGEIVWLSDGLAEPEDAESTSSLASRLARVAPLSIYKPAAGREPLLLRSGPANTATPEVTIMRASATGAETRDLRIIGADGTALAVEPIDFAVDETHVDKRLDLPADWRNRIRRIEVEGETTAGAVILLDDRWQRYRVGIVPDAGGGPEASLLSGEYYVERALTPIADVATGTNAALLASQPGVLVMVDGSLESGEEADAVSHWIEKGGVLIRFAGPVLAHSAFRDDLLPVRLRPGDRSLGGAMSWQEPGHLAPFGEDSPFAGLGLPDDVVINRQMLAEPAFDASAQVWAQLEDGSPLITAARRGNGWIVFVHTSANTAWSTLPLSGLFADMMQRLVELGRGTAGQGDDVMLSASETLDGFGRASAPPTGAAPLAAKALATTTPGPLHPPGFYRYQERFRALNLSPTIADLRPIGPLPHDVRTADYAPGLERNLGWWLLRTAIALAIVDLVASILLRGYLKGLTDFGRRGGVAAGVCLAVMVAPFAAHAQKVVADGTAPPEVLTTRLAYVVTGNSEVDEVSRAGLTGLGFIINRRTAAELGPPVGVNLERDELTFFPLIYWPLVDGAPLPSPAAARAVRAFMRSGGTVLFDTRQRLSDGASDQMRQLATVLDLPPLIVVPDDHLLHRAYYLVSDLPGRWTGPPVWVEETDARVNDGVTTVVAGSNDWASAWAVDSLLRPMFPVIPGGERQREMAYRFGVNLVMNTLTGSYKADQVHLPAIIERLSQ